jgi:hypothetical protein
LPASPHHIVDAAQDLLHLAYLRLVLQVDGRVEVRDLSTDTAAAAAAAADTAAAANRLSCMLLLRSAVAPCKACACGMLLAVPGCQASCVCSVW